MLGDVHEGLDFPLEVVDSATVRGKYEFYHYNVDGIDDRVSVLDNYPVMLEDCSLAF